MSTVTREQLSPKNVLDVLSRHILVDGYHVVMDMERSRGSYLYDARSDRPILDFFSCFATIPIGYNHPKMEDPEFREALMEAALTKPSTSDIYTEHFARFVETFSDLAVPPAHSDHMFFVEGGTLAIENTLKTAFDWKIRKNLARGQGREGHEDPALPERLPRPLGLLALDDEHGRPAQDPVLPEVRLAAPVLPEPLLPGDRAGRPRGRRRRGGRRARDPRRLRREPRRHRGADPRADPGRGRRQPLPPRALPPPARARRRARVPPDLRRGPDRRRPDRLDVVLAADGRRARHVRVRQEDAGLRLRLQPPDRRRPGQRLQGLLPHQLDVGRQPRRHDPLRRSTSRSSPRRT